MYTPQQFGDFILLRNMIERHPHQDIIAAFAKRMRNTWQLLFLPAILSYGVSFIIFPYLKNIDLLSFVVAIVFAVIIFNMKRRYFSPKFSKGMVEASLKQNPHQDEAELVRQILGVLQKKMTLVWLLGFLIVLDGVLFYWITFYPGNNMHIYFVIGALSLLFNYPRRELFENLPWYVAEEKRQFEK